MDLYIFLSIFSLMLSLFLAINVKSRFRGNKYRYFILLMLSVGIWSVFAAAEQIFDIYSIKIISSKLSYIGISALPPMLFLFSFEYSGNSEYHKKRHIPIFFVIPVITVLLVFTNEWHSLIWSNIYRLSDSDLYILKYEYGIWFFVNSVYSYILISISFFRIIYSMIKRKLLKDFTLILAALLIPVITNILYLAKYTVADYSSVAFTTTCIFFAWAILRGFFESRLLIGELISTNMKEGVIFIDERHQIIYSNPYAESFLKKDNSNGITDAPSMLPFWEELRPKLSLDADEMLEVSNKKAGNAEWHMIHIYSFKKNKNLTGWLLIILDITGRKEAEQQLERRNELISAVSSATGLFLKEHDYIKALAGGLEMLASAASIERICYFENSLVKETGYASKKIEYNMDNKSFLSLQENNAKIPFSNISEIIEILMERRAFVSDSNHMILGTIFSPFFMVLPLFIRDGFWGFISFENTIKRLWDQAEISALETFVNSISRAIERSLYENALREEHLKAQEASIAKGRFLANMSHEIRTPMNSIRGFIEMLSGTYLNEEQYDYTREIEKASETLSALIDNILDYSEIEAGKLELESMEFDIQSVVEDSAMLLSPKGHKKSLEIITHINRDIPLLVKGDPQKLKQVLINLIGNAVKFTDSGEIITRAVLKSQDERFFKIEFSVEDTGIGITLEHQERLFELFNQADSSTTRKYGGTGLGLSISKKIVELMGGNIKVESSLNLGSKFVFTARFEKTHNNAFENKTKCNINKGQKLLLINDNTAYQKTLKEYLYDIGFDTESIYEMTIEEFIMNKITIDSAAFIINHPVNHIQTSRNIIKRLEEINNQAQKKIINIVSILNKKEIMAFYGNNEKCIFILKPLRKTDLIRSFNERTRKSSIKKQEEEYKDNKAASEKDKRILLVEDNEANVKLINMMLKKIGFQNDIANNGLEAVKACEKYKYCLILMDCQMPVMDGYEATQKIRSGSDQNSRMPIIALTANALPEDREKCIKTGMNDFLTKPVSLKAIEDIINKWL